MKIFHESKSDIWFTIGPASESPEMLEKLIEAGATGARVCLSYGNEEIWKERVNRIRAASKKAGKECKIVADLPGEKLRLGELGGINKLDVKKGDQWKFVEFPEQFNENKRQIPVNAKNFVSRISKGDKIAVGDGSTILEVLEKHPNHLLCGVLVDGVINPCRGLIVQSDVFQPSCLMEKDIRALNFLASSHIFDAVALSFVSSAKDVSDARKIIGSEIPIIAKIETKKGVEKLKEILAEADAVMIARGDLALFAPWQELGHIVDKIVSVSKSMGKPWIMATQIAEGLEKFVFPTRAEICDLTRWGNEGVRAVMFSYETAFGPKPVEAVNCAKEILETCESKRSKNPYEM